MALLRPSRPEMVGICLREKDAWWSHGPCPSGPFAYSRSRTSCLEVLFAELPGHFCVILLAFAQIGFLITWPRTIPGAGLLVFLSCVQRVFLIAAS
jgi:hypothetical protein